MSGLCDRCGRVIESPSDAVICTHLNSLPTISHRACALQSSSMSPPVIFKFGVRTIPFFIIINILNLIIGVISLSWGLIEISQPRDLYAPIFPTQLLIGPFMIAIGSVMLYRINKIAKQINKKRF
jgi:hypothetical protein